MKEDQASWVCQKAFIEKNDLVLVLEDPIEGLDFPGGKIQIGETDLLESLKREVKEETGLEIKVGDPFVVWHSEFPKNHKYVGKKVYLVGFRCQYVSGKIRLSKEHSKWRWVNRDNYSQVREDSNFYQALEKYFS